MTKLTKQAPGTCSRSFVCTSQFKILMITIINIKSLVTFGPFDVKLSELDACRRKNFPCLKIKIFRCALCGRVQLKVPSIDDSVRIESNDLRFFFA